ncbi:hypothetical protein AGMMS50212_05820 [Spirochaetia bacterium]|nr:hypothetical protein AGMMS50212_05820 [Spirochaetia bacterium]
MSILEENLPILTNEIATTKLRDFFREKPFVVFGTGMSCALDSRFGMDALKDNLIETMKTCSMIDKQKAEWAQVVATLKTGSDLENALNSVTDPGLLDILTTLTASFVAILNKEYSKKIAKGDADWPAIHLLQKIIDGLSGSDKVLHVLTPNYDMLFEYACGFSGIPYSDGFFGGVERRLDWASVAQAFLETIPVYTRSRRKQKYQIKPHICLYKVHGSLNYFFYHDAVIANDSWINDPPDFALRVMVTPGTLKHRTLQKYRQELLKKADSEIDKSARFLFLGYGFNDIHLEEYIQRKIVSQSCHGLIITRDSNARIEKLLSESSNFWLVCKTSNEQDEEGTSIVNKQYGGALFLSKKNLWNVTEFTSTILGGQ